MYLLFACQPSHPETTDVSKGAAPTTTSDTETTEVNTLRLQPQTFAKEVLSQGKIEARFVSDVTFDLTERIEAVLAETGQRVTKGQILARLRDFELQNQLQKLDHQIEQARINFEEKLISLGYTLADSAAVPPAILKTARLESNLEGLQIERSLALYKLEQAKVKAPISGIIGEVEAQPGNPTSAYKKLCTIIDDSRLEAVFPVLEQELPLVQTGQSVVIRPLHQSGKSYTARVSAILPQVDEFGMVQVFARLSEGSKGLLDGMHITAVIKDEVKDQLVAPKSAVVDRQGRLVVFVHRDGQAHWQYVQIGQENSDSYTITDGLQAGDEIIVSNTFHLSHLQQVQVVKTADQDGQPRRI